MDDFNVMFHIVLFLTANLKEPPNLRVTSFYALLLDKCKYHCPAVVAWR